jgi:hypothetical protein
MKKYTIIALIALVASTGALFAQKTINKSYTGIKRIKVATASGDCEIKKSSGSSVEVMLKHTYDEGEYTPRFEQEGDRLIIGENHHGNNSNGNAQWTLTVPDGIQINFSTGSGNLVAKGVDVRLDANTGSGDLEFSSMKGELDANTGSGNVEVASFKGMAKVNTGSGDMDITDTDGELDLNCGSGDIKVSGAKGYFDLNTGSGNIRAEKLTISSSSKFNTGSGRAQVALAAAPTADISVNSGSGTSEVNFSGNEISGLVVMKASKRNGRISAPFEFDKTEEETHGNGSDNVTVVKTAQRGKGTNRIYISTGSGDAVLKQ